ncbi:MAG TPA: RING finger protein [Solirubrobacteraceae bacterium]|jgi:hypothetical protein
MSIGTQGPRRSVATTEQTGRACPYCRFPLKEGVEIVECGVCQAAHHGDCWSDNAGCAVVACLGGPSSEAAAALPAAAPTAAPVAAPTSVSPQAPAAAPAVPVAGYGGPPPPPQQPWAGTPQPSPPSRTGPWLIAAVLVLALAVGGTAVAVITTGGDNSTSPAETVTVGEQASETPAIPSEEPTDEGIEPAVEEGTEPATDPNAFPDISRSQMRSEIETLLIDHHQAIVEGDYSSAWDLMTARKQRQKEADPGYAQWADDQSTLSGYLKPSGLRARIQDVNEATGVVQVMVTGMRWTKPGATCSEWSGVTWVRWENGGWYYDPGYSTTPQRTRDWKNRFSELLGGSC